MWEIEGGVDAEVFLCFIYFFCCFLLRIRCVKTMILTSLPNPKRHDAKILSNYFYSKTSLLKLICKKLWKKFILCEMKHFDCLGIAQANQVACITRNENFIIPFSSFKNDFSFFSNHYRCIFSAILKSLIIFNQSLIKSI